MIGRYRHGVSGLGPSQPTSTKPVTAPPRRGVLTPFQLILLLNLGAAIIWFHFLPYQDLRWALYAYFLMALGWVVIGLVFEHLDVAASPRTPADEKPVGAWEFNSLLTSLKRADRGLTYSQVALALRVRSAFLEKLKAFRNLDDTGLEELLSNPAELRSVVRSELIAEFLEDTARGQELLMSHDRHRQPQFRFVRGMPYSIALERLLRVMEDWY